MSSDATEPKATEPKPLTIWQALPKITGEITPIAKDRKNPQQGYNFRGIDDVYAALNLLLAKYGVSVLPKILLSEHDLFTTKNGANMFRHRIKIQYKLVAADGSHDFAESEGEGMDTGDKATPKAFSTAFKSMAFQVFCIPTGEKIDSENDSPEVATPAAAAVKQGNGHSAPAKPAPEKQQSKPERNPDEVYEELAQSLAAAKTSEELATRAKAIAAAHKSGKIDEQHRKGLLAVYNAKTIDLSGAAN